MGVHRPIVDCTKNHAIITGNMLPARQESPTTHQLSFLGSELFEPDKALQIDFLIQQLITQQPDTVISLCEKGGIGWDPSGYPETKAISHVEQGVKRRGCAAIAIETANLLGVNLETHEVINLILEDRGYDYKKVPERVLKFVQSKR
jgi:hypothetical protein